MRIKRREKSLRIGDESKHMSSKERLHLRQQQEPRFQEMEKEAEERKKKEEIRAAHKEREEAIKKQETEDLEKASKIMSDFIKDLEQLKEERTS